MHKQLELHDGPLRCALRSRSAAIHDLVLDDGRGEPFRPLAEAPWRDEPEAASDADVPAHRRSLGGEWACFPFGRTAFDPVVHGFATDHDWQLERLSDASARAVIDLPDACPFEGITREITLEGSTGTVTVDLTVLPRISATIPCGLHPIIGPPETVGRFSLDVGFDHGETFPVLFEPGASRLAIDRRFDDLAALPLEMGGTASLADLFDTTGEDAAQVHGLSSGSATVRFPDSGACFDLLWQPEHFPSLLLWVSNRGRRSRPWNGRFRGLGVEPIHGRFVADDEGVRIDGGIAFSAGVPWTTRYAMRLTRTG